MDAFIRRLIENEEQAVTSVMAFMSYNPSIGRVLQKGGVRKFQDIVTRVAPQMARIADRRAFDLFHHSFVAEVLSTFTTARGGSLSYGQAQKPVNVFFKVYADWARKPSDAVRERLLPHLHVPLDSILMREVKREYPTWYHEVIRPLLSRAQQEFSLSMIDEERYMKWQRFFRDKHPDKPLLFDVTWALSRKKGRQTRRHDTE